MNLYDLCISVLGSDFPATFQCCTDVLVPSPLLQESIEASMGRQPIISSFARQPDAITSGNTSYTAMPLVILHVRDKKRPLIAHNGRRIKENRSVVSLSDLNVVAQCESWYNTWRTCFTQLLSKTNAVGNGGIMVYTSYYIWCDLRMNTQGILQERLPEACQ